MKDSGRAIIGIGIGVGEERAIEAAKQAVSSPLLETSITGATDAIINITGGVNLTLFEAEQAAEVVRAASGNDINTIFGSVINENLSDEVIVTVIATGFDKKGEENTKQPVFSNVGQSSTPNRRSREEISYVATMPQSNDEDDDDGEILDDTDYDFPPFLRDKNF